MIEVWLYEVPVVIDRLLNQGEALQQVGEPSKKMTLVEYQLFISRWKVRCYPLFVSIGVSLNQVEEVKSLLVKKTWFLVKGMTVKEGWFKKRPATEMEKLSRLMHLLMCDYVPEYSRLYWRLEKIHTQVVNGKFVNQERLLDIVCLIKQIN